MATGKTVFVQMKKLPEISPDAVRKAFEHKNMEVVNDPLVFSELVSGLESHEGSFLFMSSGTFGNFSLHNFVERLQRAEQKCTYN